MLAGMWSLGAISLLFGTCSGYISGFIYDIGAELSVFRNLPSPFLRTAADRISVGGFSSVFAFVILVILVIATAAVYLAVNFPAARRRKITTGPTWDCGANLTPHMEITSTGFSRSLVVIFKGLLKPTMQRSVEYRDGETRYLPKSRTISIGVNDIYDKYLYEPAERLVERFSLQAKKVQSGLINMYILYILVALLGVLLFSL
jgi:hydrogenase-4 component B